MRGKGEGKGGREGGNKRGTGRWEEEEDGIKRASTMYIHVYGIADVFAAACINYTCTFKIFPNNIIISYPLSEVKNTSVLLATPFSLRSAMTLPTAQSRLASESPNGPLRVELVNSLEAN